MGNQRRLRMKRLVMILIAVFLFCLGVNSPFFWDTFHMLFSDSEYRIPACTAEAIEGGSAVRAECHLGAGTFSLYFLLRDPTASDGETCSLAFRFALGNVEKEAIAKGVFYNGKAKIKALSFSRTLIDSFSQKAALEIDLIEAPGVNGFGIEVFRAH